MRHSVSVAFDHDDGIVWSKMMAWAFIRKVVERRMVQGYGVDDIHVMDQIDTDDIRQVIWKWRDTGEIYDILLRAQREHSIDRCRRGDFEH